LKAIEGLNLL